MAKDKMQESAAVRSEEDVVRAVGDAPNRPVRVKLFKDNDRYSAPLFVSVNGYAITVPRGVEVTVPYFAAEVIRQSEEQDAATSVMIAELEADSGAL
jgi:predicted acyltransferase